MVGAVRFELTTSCTRNKRATRLRYAPNQGGKLCRRVGLLATLKYWIARCPPFRVFHRCQDELYLNTLKGGHRTSRSSINSALSLQPSTLRSDAQRQQLRAAVNVIAAIIPAQRPQGLDGRRHFL